MKLKIALALIICALLISCASAGGSGDSGVDGSGNYVRNGDFSRFASDWPNLPYNWSTTFKGGDGYSPIKTENGRFIGWAENLYSFTLHQNIAGLTPGKYFLTAEFRLNPDSIVDDMVMNVWSGRTLLASLSVAAELRGAPRETDIMYELLDIDVPSNSVRIEFIGTDILKYIGIDNVFFAKQ